MRILLSLVLTCLITNTRADVPIITNGKAMAIIVTSDRPSQVASYAANELALHIEKATGIRLRIAKESESSRAASHLFIGDCEASRAAGIDVKQLTPEAFVLRAQGNDLFIVGDDKNDDPLDADTRAGTLWGAYEWLDRAVHARWLWPGEGGTFVQKTTSIVAIDVNETVPMKLFQRKIRPGLGMESEHPAMGFTKAAFEQYSRDQTVFLRRHRMGRSFPMGYGHAFTDWWQKYGNEHPEWFQLREDGKRGPKKSTSRFSMCVSNPEFRQQLVTNWKAKGGKFINACENDILGTCTCALCQGLDGPAPADYLTYYSPSSKMVGSRFVSDRYAHFWLNVQQLAAKTDPDATVIGYVYFNYFQAPTSGVKLNPNILLGFCPSGGFFPRSDAEHAWMKQQWSGWRDTGARLFLRTNHLLDGYCMPYIFVHQFADEFQHAARNGMVATDFDSLTGQWSTQGPTLYVASRLHVKPEASVDDLLAEYYNAFGKAAPDVKRYFDYWESYTATHRESLAKSFEELQASRWRSFAKAAHAIFSLECFAPADAILDEAAKAVANDSEASARIEFLKLGLAHAMLCVRVASQLTIAQPTATKEQTKALLEELIAFRRANERKGIANFNQLAWVEDLSWKLSDETKQAPDLYP
ncbi:MAG: DUF4838 domain-containing protein [Verrucomicrobiaceae bacterium]|nr:DUF4838 domain-containing protein [Verrucomicrobiaceae bacterium]